MKIEDIKKCKYVMINFPAGWQGYEISDGEVVEWLDERLSKGFMFCSWSLAAGGVITKGIFLDMNEKG